MATGEAAIGPEGIAGDPGSGDPGSGAPLGKRSPRGRLGRGRVSRRIGRGPSRRRHAATVRQQTPRMILTPLQYCLKRGTGTPRIPIRLCPQSKMPFRSQIMTPNASHMRAKLASMDLPKVPKSRQPNASPRGKALAGKQREDRPEVRTMRTRHGRPLDAARRRRHRLQRSWPLERQPAQPLTTTSGRWSSTRPSSPSCSGSRPSRTPSARLAAWRLGPATHGRRGRTGRRQQQVLAKGAGAATGAKGAGGPRGRAGIKLCLLTERS
mmetsp:Transcript_141957/g.344807  ORF Transcript_141957/g.344807 Transcript_141957/m.344807 type:complete len:267 (-) Transcript_141957:221-1021(-)